MKHLKSIFSALSNLTTVVFLTLLIVVTIFTVSGSRPLADDETVLPSVNESPIAKIAESDTPRRTSTGDPWFEPDTMVQIYTGKGETGWETVPYASIPRETEYLFEERLYHIDADGWVKVHRNAIADAKNLSEAGRAYEPGNWRFPNPEDLVRFVDEDNQHLRHDLADRFKPGDRFWFQGMLYEGLEDPNDPAFRILNPTGYALSQDGKMVLADEFPVASGNASDETLVSQVNFTAETGMQNTPLNSGTGSSPTDFDFTGKRKEDFNLLDYDARYYGPTIGRFISPDPIVPDYTNPQDLNRYSYVRNNPINYTDPTGHCTQMENDPDGLCIRTGSDGQIAGIVRGGSFFPNFMEKAIANAGYTGNANYINNLPDGANNFTTVERPMRNVANDGIPYDGDISIGTAFLLWFSGKSPGYNNSSTRIGDGNLSQSQYKDIMSEGGWVGQQNTTPSKVTAFGDPFEVSYDPARPPGPDWEWRGEGPIGSNQGAWYNSTTEASLHPDFNHPPPILPHYDYNYRNSGARGWRIYPDGRVEPK